MGSRPATELLLLPVQLQGIRLGRPVDLLLDPEAWRALGFVVLCGDESPRFLPFAAADLKVDEIGVPSALLLLEDVDFYRERSRSLRALLGELRDILVRADGTVTSLVLERDGRVDEVVPADAGIESAAASSA